MKIRSFPRVADSNGATDSRGLEALHALRTAAIPRSGIAEAEVMDSVVKQLQALGLRGGITMLDDEGKTLVVRALAFPQKELLHQLERLTGLHILGFSFPVDRAEVYRRVVETGEFVFVPDSIKVIAQLMPETARGLTEKIYSVFGRQQSAFAPIHARGRVVGVLNVSAPTLDEANQAVAQIFASQVGMVLENVWLLQETRDSRDVVLNMLGDLDKTASQLREKNERLRALQEIMRAASSSLDPRQVLRVVRERISLIMPEVYPPLFVIVDEEANLIRTFIVAPESSLLATVKEMTGLSLGDLSAPLSVLRNSPNWQKWMAGEAVMGHDLSEMLSGALPGAPLVLFQKAMGLQSMAFLPLLTQTRLHGLMLVFARREVSPDDVALLLALAAQAAVAVENARLYQEVQASELEYRTLVKNATELIWMMDTEGRLTFINEQAEKAGGSKAENWLGKNFAASIPVEDRPRVQQIFEETLAGKTQSYEARTYRADGSLLCLSVNTAPLYREGNVVGTISFARDVTEECRLRRDTEQRLAELSALFTISSGLRQAKTLDEMLMIILSKTLDVLKADTGSLSLLKENILVCRAAIGQREGLIGKSIPINEGITGRVAFTGEPHHSPDFQHDGLLALEPDRTAAVEGIASDLCVPLKTAEQVIGVMHISTHAPRLFIEDEIHLVTAIADMAASAIHRAILFEELEHRVHELSTLFDVGKMVTATLRIQEVLDFIIRAASDTLHAEAGYLFLWDELEERLVLRAVQGFSPELIKQVKYRVGEGLAGWVFRESKSANVPNVAADPRWKPEPEQEKTLSAGRIANVLVAPLVLGNKTLGALGVANKIDTPAFTESDQSMLTTLAGQIAVAIENARLYEDVRGISIAVIRSLATAIDARDPYTRGHSEEVTRLAVQVARELGWSGADLEMLEFAALLHDVGKIAVPDAVLGKPGALTPDGWDIIRMHPYHSAQIVKPIEPLKRIIPWIYHHQERWDGSGYPDGSKGDAIPLAARIIAVVDAFNAMTTDRPYRRAKTFDEALAELQRCAGTQFDPHLVQVLQTLLEQSFEPGKNLDTEGSDS